MDATERANRIAAVFWEKHLVFMKKPYLRLAHSVKNIKASPLVGFDVTNAERIVAWRAYYKDPQSAKAAYLAITAEGACLKHCVRAGGVKYPAGASLSVMPASVAGVVPDRYWNTH